MSTPERRQQPAPHATDAAYPSTASTPAIVVALLKDVDARLRGWHITRTDRLAITEGLHADLLAAHADGRDPRQLLGPDVDDFVQNIVAEGAYSTTTHNPVRLSVRGTLIAVAAVIAAYLLTTKVVVPIFTTLISAHLTLPHTGVAGGWVGVGVVAVLAVLGVLWMVLRDKAGSSETLKAAALALVVAAGLAIAGNVMVLQAAPQITTGSVTLQVLIVLLPLAGALTVSRWWGLRRARSLTQP